MKRKQIGQISMTDEIIVDLFAGGGGASTGIEIATGRVVNVAVNHNPEAIRLHQTNHKFTEHYQEDIWKVDPKTVCKGRPVGLLWASPDCRHFSKAKGAALVDRKIRGLAWVILRWAGEVRPRVILMENVEEFVTWGPVRKGKPVKKLSGTTFERFLKQLRALGYEVEYRELVAADYGAPTSRKRLVLCARCDGRPIVWPERTHAPADSPEVKSGKCKPWRAAAEIIDWTLPMYSIFDSKAEIKEKYGVNAVRPLADNTLRRIIRGVDKFTIQSGKPFIVFSNTGHSVGNPTDNPIGVVRTAGGEILSSVQMIQYHTEQTENVRANGLNGLLPTVDASNRYGLISASLTEYYGNGNPIPMGEPMRTVTSHDREALLACHLDKYYAGGYSGKGNSPEEPITTITVEPRQSLIAAHIAEFKGQCKGQSVAEPLFTITASAGEFGLVGTQIVRYEDGARLGRWPEIRSLLNKYCGYHLDENEILLLSIGGALWYISDIFMRMLAPRELYNAMGFPVDYIIDHDYTGREYKKTSQVARCGNAVCPPMAEAVVRANLPEWCGGKITTMEELRRHVAV